MRISSYSSGSTGLTFHKKKDNRATRRTTYQAKWTPPFNPGAFSVIKWTANCTRSWEVSTLSRRLA